MCTGEETAALDEITVIHQDGDEFAILVRDHVIRVDQPYRAGGEDAGPTPVELFVASLAACAGHYGHRYLAKQGLRGEGLEIRAKYMMSMGRPARVTRIRMEVQCPTGLSPAHLDGLMKAIEGCTVHNSLHRPPAIELEVAPCAQAA